MHTIMVLNAKGGCGKTTIATVVACYFAECGLNTALMDFDPQGSSTRWLEARGTDRPAIKAINAVRPKSGLTRSWQLYSGSETDIVIMDTPAGVTGGQLMDLYRRADTILIPVMPSIIDLHAIEAFLGEMTRLFKRSNQGKRIGVIVNRVRIKTRSLESIEQLVEGAGFPLLGSLRDTQNYAIAMEAGLGINEIKTSGTTKDRRHWQPIFEWLFQAIPGKQPETAIVDPESEDWDNTKSSPAKYAIY
ncbi:MAG: ParA family protein [Gammaproteobacteria bacterium]|nr:ParA family protein [Gammaproteobacteria bacterium]